MTSADICKQKQRSETGAADVRPNTGTTKINEDYAHTHVDLSKRGELSPVFRMSPRAMPSIILVVPIIVTITHTLFCRIVYDCRTSRNRLTTMSCRFPLFQNLETAVT